MQSWFYFAIGSMASFAGMALTFKRLTYSVATPIILLYVFIANTVLYSLYTAYSRESLSVTWQQILWLVAASVFAFVGNLCDVQALRLAPNPGYAGAVKAGQIVVLTFAACVMFPDQQLSVSGVVGVGLVFCGVLLLALQR